MPTGTVWRKWLAPWATGGLRRCGGAGGGHLPARAGRRAPILVLGGIWGDQVPQYLEHDLTLTASSVERLEQIDAVAGQMGVRARVHLKIDTGMERIGVHYYSAQTLQEAALNCRNVEVEGIFSHFANADAPT